MYIGECELIVAIEKENQIGRLMFSETLFCNITGLFYIYTVIQLFKIIFYNTSVPSTVLNKPNILEPCLAFNSVRHI